jgi:CRISPR-associated protein Cmr1
MDGKSLHALEAQVFGGSDSEEGRTLRIRTCWQGYGQEAFPRMNDDTNKNIKRSAIPAGSAFTLAFDTPRPPTKSDECWQLALALLCMLGGLGARTRRGFGSLAITDIESWAGTDVISALLKPQWLHDPDKSQHIKSQFQNSLKTLIERLRTSANVTSNDDNNIGDFSVLSKLNTRIWVITPSNTPNGLWGSWDAAMDSLRKGFYRPLKTYLHRSEIGCAHRNDRRASPLVIQIKQCPVPTRSGIGTENGYFGVAVEFRHRKSALDLKWIDKDPKQSKTLASFIADNSLHTNLKIEGIRPWN